MQMLQEEEQGTYLLCIFSGDTRNIDDVDDVHCITNIDLLFISEQTTHNFWFELQTSPCAGSRAIACVFRSRLRNDTPSPVLLLIYLVSLLEVRAESAIMFFLVFVFGK